MALVTYVTLLLGRTTIHWHFVSNKRTRETHNPKHKEIKIQNTKLKIQNIKFRNVYFCHGI